MLSPKPFPWNKASPWGKTFGASPNALFHCFGERTRLACCLRRLAAILHRLHSTTLSDRPTPNPSRGADGNTPGRVCSPEL